MGLVSTILNKENREERAAMTSLSAALSETNKGVVIRLHVQPGAKHNRLQGLHGDAIKLQVQAPPISGRANKAVIELLASALQLRHARIELIGGASSRRKRFLLIGLEPQAVHAQLARILSG